MRRMRLVQAILVCAFAVLLAGRWAEAKRPLKPEAQRVAAVARVLVKAYDGDSGLFRGTGWWNSANGITALANASRVLDSREFDAIFKTTFVQAQHKHAGFLNEFYDDEGWWALAWLDVYELHGGPDYLKMSQSIFNDMTTGWSESCGGGIWWKKNEHYKNAIANELFLSVAVRLAARSSGKERAGYLEWAAKEERWFVGSGMINADGLVNDGLDAACHNNGKTTWTYNQGVILTGLSGFGALGKDAAATQLADRIAGAAGTKLVDAGGILHDVCEPHCGEDGVQFKGILVRNLVTLRKSPGGAEVESLLKKNADSVWDHARTESGLYSVDWAGPPEESGTGSLISALDALTAPLLRARK